MFAKQLNALCIRTSPPVTNASLARALISQGCPISTVYLSQLRTGVRTQPSDHIVRTLAAHFDVPLEYFYPTIDSTTKLDTVDEPAVISDLLDPSIRRLLSCSQDLSPTSTSLLIEFADHLRKAENRPRRCADAHAWPLNDIAAYGTSPQNPIAEEKARTTPAPEGKLPGRAALDTNLST